jgi:hypothetical protein
MMTPQQKSKLSFFTIAGALIITSVIWIFPRMTSNSNSSQDFAGLYPKLMADFEKRRAGAVQLPFEEGQSVVHSARRPESILVPGETSRPSTRIILKDPYGDRISDDAEWSFILDQKQHVYWAYYNPGYSSPENYRNSSGVYGPFPLP